MVNPKSLDKKRPEVCSVVDEFCLLPANLEPQRRTNVRCFGCGQPVCANCSLLTTWYTFGRQRICHNCLRELHDQADPIVLEHLYLLAGYTAGTGTRVAVEQALQAAAIHKQLGPRRALAKVRPRPKP